MESGKSNNELENGVLFALTANNPENAKAHLDRLYEKYSYDDLKDALNKQGKKEIDQHYNRIKKLNPFGIKSSEFFVKQHENSINILKQNLNELNYHLESISNVKTSPEKTFEKHSINSNYSNNNKPKEQRKTNNLSMENARTK